MYNVERERERENSIIIKQVYVPGEHNMYYTYCMKYTTADFVESVTNCCHKVVT